MEAYKKEFIEFMVESDVLKFGEFTLKSGRKSPFFMNAGAYVTGSQLHRLGQYYAKAIHDRYGDDFDVLFGPAYKGIPLAVVTAIAFNELYGKEIRYCSDRKEEKDHGADKGNFLGSNLKDGDRVVMIEDVTTSGKSMEETVPKVKGAADVTIVGLMVSLDRMEVGKGGEKCALDEVKDLYGFETNAIVTMSDVVEHLYNKECNGKVVIDVGGIHDALEGSTDLWEDLGYPDGKRPRPDETAAKTKKHRITVLYMERGAGASNCQMEFTLPNSRILDVTEVPKATLSLKKVNSKDEAISGAKFKLVSKADENDYDEVTSDTNGFVTFNDLKEGVDYTLTEVSVPGDYIAETTSWTVKLERDSSNTLKAVLYNNDTKLETAADGTYHIVNYKQEELVNQSVESNKTVSLLDWDQRTYRIDLTASSTTTQSMKTPYDIVMVLDRSGSMSKKFVEYKKCTTQMYSSGTYFIKTQSGIYQKLEYKNKKWTYTDSYTKKKVTVDQNSTDVYVAQYSTKTKIEALRNAATKFVDNVAEKNSDCRVGIVTFSTDGDIKK